jgi:ABC transport system ATP-binding/permease protein
MAIVTLREVSVGFHGPLLLDGVDCQIEAGQKIGLLGRNGSGKTTLMRILRGDLPPDAGHVVRAPGMRVSLLPQDVPQNVSGTIAEVVAQGLTPDDDPHESAWRAEQQVKEILSRMDLDGSARFEVLSSGMKRRVLLAKTLVSAPDLLLLDEPTNHLDIQAIAWLEDFLARWNTTLLFVTHDRMFLRKLASRILEIDRGRLFDWSCDYDTFLERKELALAGEERQNALFDKRLAEEERWIRQGIKARRTRNEGRVRALEQMRRDRSNRRSSTGAVQMEIHEGQRSGALVAQVEHLSFAYPRVEKGDRHLAATESDRQPDTVARSQSPFSTASDGERPIVCDFSTMIMRGDKIGIIGPNGAGKTTLLRIFLGQLPPQSGKVRLGSNLQIAYFDQRREQLDDERTVAENVADGYDTVPGGGSPRHIIGYLQDFLFSPERARTQVRFLSGGERNRVLLARLFAKPANVIVLDEPTNDLDTETLELLEERLVQFEGTVLLVSHDRAFLNNIVTSTIVFEDGDAREYVGGYDDWLRQRSSKISEKVEAKRDKSQSTNRGDEKTAGTVTKRRLTYKEQQEQIALPALIEQLEAEISELHDAMAKPEFYQQPGPAIAKEQARLGELEARRTAAYRRWEELEQLGE